MRFDRSSGVLLHPTSLPGPDGIGDLGNHAYRFIDFLVRAKQGLWQVMPLGPTSYGDSPYAATSAFAGNPLLISLARLRGKTEGEPSGSPVDYGRVTTEKVARLRDALADDTPEHDAALVELTRDHPWIDDYALFAALKEASGGRRWPEWPAPLAHREPAALRRFRHEHAGAIRFHALAQQAFARQWQALREHANAAGIRLVGDVPIFVAHDSADVWARPDLFHLDEAGEPTKVAGVPPDYFSPTGQLWGNPLYRWEAMADEGFAWWIERFRHLFRLVDVARIDHFRGFVAHWSVPAGEPTAENGVWEPAPGAALFEAIQGALGDLPIVAEDLGLITPDVVALRDRFGYPGMKVLQFAFGDTPANAFLPHNFEPNCVVYTGTHDNDTTAGWFASIADTEKHRVRVYLGSDASDPAWELIRLGQRSVADTFVVPMQDLLSLGTEARMNVPGRPGGNWAWRCPPEAFSDDLADRLAELTYAYGRAQSAIEPP